MKSFVARRNIERYEKLLESAPDEAARRVLLDLLRQEKEKLAELARQEQQPMQGRPIGSGANGVAKND